MLVVWLLEDMLADLGCAVVGPASSVNQALAMIDAEAIDAAVLDVNLNGKMSYPIADALTARGVPFAFSTGYDNDTLLDDYRSFPVLQKPFHRDGIERHARESAHAKDVESRIGASGYYGIVALRPASTCCRASRQSGHLLDSATPPKYECSRSWHDANEMRMFQLAARTADEGTLGLAKTLWLVAFLLMQGDIQWLIN